MTILAERCPRCQGRLIEEPDADGQIERTCINCGFVAYLNSRSEPVIARTIEEERALLKLAGVR